MEKYGRRDASRPRGFFARLEQLTVYAIRIERVSGKEAPLPSMEDRWPATDQTKSQDATR